MTEYVYVMTNPAMPGVVKIGRSNNPGRRAAELSGTSVPHPFEVVGAVPTSSAAVLEARAHAHFAGQRASYNREFFQVSPAEALEALRRIGASMVIIDLEPVRRGFWTSYDRWCERQPPARILIYFLLLLASPYIIIGGGLTLVGIWDAIAGAVAGDAPAVQDRITNTAGTAGNSARLGDLTR